MNCEGFCCSVVVDPVPDPKLLAGSGSEISHYIQKVPKQSTDPNPNPKPFVK